MASINLQTEELFVRIHLKFADGNTAARDYPGMYAFHDSNCRVVVKAYGDPENSIPRAIFEQDYVPGFEHFGDHITAQAEMKKAREVRQQERQKKEPFTIDEREMAKDREVLPQVLRNAVDTFGKDDEGDFHTNHPEVAFAVSTALMKGKSPEEIGDAFAHLTPAEEQPEEKKFLEEAPKAEEPLSTMEESGSDPKMVETPSIKFLRTVAETTKEVGRSVNSFGPVSTEMVGLNEPYAPGALDNRETRRAKARGTHKKTKPIPGATLLVAMALSLSVLFRHPQY